MPSTNITIRMDSQLKKQGEELFKDMGLSMTSAITAFIKQSVREQGLPFHLSRKPNLNTADINLKAIKEIEDMERHPEKHKSYSNAAEMFKDIL